MPGAASVPGLEPPAPAPLPAPPAPSPVPAPLLPFPGLLPDLQADSGVFERRQQRTGGPDPLRPCMTGPVVPANQARPLSLTRQAAPRCCARSGRGRLRRRSARSRILVRCAGRQQRRSGRGRRQRCGSTGRATTLQGLTEQTGWAIRPGPHIQPFVSLPQAVPPRAPLCGVVNGQVGAARGCGVAQALQGRGGKGEGRVGKLAGHVQWRRLSP